MFRAASVRLVSFGPSRALATLFAVLLLLTIDGLVPPRADAGTSFGRQVTTTRRAQVGAATIMRRADHRLKAIRKQRSASKQERKASKRRVSKARQRRAKAQARIERAKDRLEIARLDLDRRTRVRPNPLKFQAANKAKPRKAVEKIRKHTRKVVRKQRKVTRKASKAVNKHQRKLRWHGRYRERIDAKIRQREAAETRLARRIDRMKDLAATRAARSRRVDRIKGRLRRPVKGVITQRFGCTQTRRSKNRRTCARFHDGIDMAGKRSAIVRASADGVVTYVGFSPWDRQKRAYIVMIVHRGGLVTLYGHLQPRQRIKAGQVVRRGQAIAYNGSTGRSTGPHVHWEAIRKGRWVDPLRVSG